MKNCELNLKLCSLILVAILLQGCFGYQFNLNTPNNISTIAVSPIVNKTDEPAVENHVMRAIQSFIQFDGRLKLVDNNEAEAIIEITLDKYSNNPISYRDDRRVAPHFYRQSIHATATLIDSSTGLIIGKTSNTGESVFEFESDLSSSKRNTQTAAADELARLIFNDLIEIW